MTPVRSELATLTRLSAPVVLTQVGLMMIGVVDTLMVSRIGVQELAASALGNAWQWGWMSAGLGLVMGIDPLVSQAHGRGDGPGTALAFQRGIVLALLASVPICVLQALTEPGLILLGQDRRVAELAGLYNVVKLPTIPCFLVYSALRQYLQGRTHMAPASWVMWAGNAVHVLLNWAFIFGNLGVPAMGLAGAALASSITTVVLLAGLCFWTYAFGLHRGAWRRWDRDSVSLAGLRQAARLGAPIGAQLSLEGWAFTWATLMAGWISVVAVGSHHIVLNMAALSFMVPLGISQGAATRVGNLIGAGDAEGMRRAAWAAVALGAAVMSVSAVLFTVLRFALPALYTDDADVIALAAQILPAAAAFQLSDGTQVVASGVLRGMRRPDAAAAANLIGYYVLALPLGYALAFSLDGGLIGIWAALAVGLAVVALYMVIWVRRTARRPLEELSVSASA